MPLATNLPRDAAERKRHDIRKFAGMPRKGATHHPAVEDICAKGKHVARALDARRRNTDSPQVVDGVVVLRHRMSATVRPDLTTAAQDVSDCETEITR